jgi:GTP pyrophosphokinase
MIIDSLKNILPFTNSKVDSDFKKILDKFPEQYILKDNDLNLLFKSYNIGLIAHEGQKRKSGEKYFVHCIEVCKQLIDWNMDLPTVIAGLLHDTIEDTDITYEILLNDFGKDIADLVKQVSKLSGIKYRNIERRQAENFMRMFLSISKDLRVIIIKFSDRLHNMKTLNFLPKDKQKRIALETLELYAPLAHRLGMNKIKMEFEDLCFKILNSNSYKKIVSEVNSTKKERQKYIDDFIKPISIQLKNYNIKTSPFGRPKHYYSIHKKIENKGKVIGELYDLIAVRIIVDSLENCYVVLGIIHQLYTPIQNRFKDYIATPKSNGYQSIHTTVFGENGEMTEVQIRTKEMDRLAEIGVAAHWKYKENKNHPTKDEELDKHISWLRDLVEILQDDYKNPEEMMELLKVDLFDNEIFTFSPKGDVHKLKVNSTPIDFAFSIHTQVGMKCKGAKINGKLSPLNTQLKNGDKIDIVTSESHFPNQAWLKIVQTTKAKTHIKRYIKKEEELASIVLGKEIVEKYLRKINQLNLMKEIDKEPEILGFNNSNIIYSNIAKGKIIIEDAIIKYDESLSDKSKIKNLKEDSLTQKFINKARGIAKGVKVGGIKNALIYFPKCCSPIPGDSIIGYVTNGKGVTIHRTNCKNAPIEKFKNRFIEVEWDFARNSSFLVRLKIDIEDRKHLLKDLTESTSSMNINIKSVDINASDGIATCLMIIEIYDIKELNRLKKRIFKNISPINFRRV